MSTSSTSSSASSSSAPATEASQAESGRCQVTAPYKPAFLQNPGTPALPWSTWLRGFEDWLLCLGVPSTPAFAVRKAAIMRSSLGQEGQRIYYSLAPTAPESYEDAVQRLRLHFGRTSGTIFNRSKFHRCLQRPGDSIVQYLSALRELARLCNFPENQFDERVRDQFASGCCNQHIRERLLQEPDEASLDSLVLLATTLERAQLEAPVLAGRFPDASISSIGQPQNASRKQHHRQSGSSTSGQSGASAAPCSNCNRQGHTSRDPACPARGKECGSCFKVGHFSVACRSSGPTSGRPNYRHRPQSQGRRNYRSQSRHRQAMQFVDAELAAESDVIIGTVTDAARPNTPNAPKIDIEKSAMTSAITVASVATAVRAPGTFRHVDTLVGDVSVDLLVDLGAKVSLLNQAAYRKLHPSTTLFKSDTALRAYGGAEIQCSGRVFVPVQLGNRKLPSFRFYVTDGPSVLGIDLFDALHGKASVAGIDLTAPLIASLSLTSSPSSVRLDQFPVLIKPKPGLLKGFVHRPTVDATVKPVRQKFWHPPLAKREPIAAELARLEQEKIIERIDTSTWTSNVVTARKKDGTLRLCVNLTDVNKCIIPERFPLPTMAELTEKLAGCTVFSKLDLLWGYLQLELAEDRRDLTAFVTHVGVFRFRSLPFGLASGPSAFQQVIRTVLSGLDGCTSILDDILVYGPSMEEHDRRLRLVLQRLSDVNATLRRDKCVIGAPEVEFNGHRISASGILPLCSNVEALMRIPTPTDQQQLSRFLSTATYYLKFVSGFADIAEPLRRLLKKDTAWCWTQDQQRSFETLKRRVAEPPVLAHFDVTCETVVTCDASAVAIGATLSQRKNGAEIPIAFASRALSPAERRYSASEREALACLWSCEHWHFYLYGRRFTLVTDHQALKTLLTTGGSGHRPLRLHRWADRLFQYVYDVEYKPGRLNVVADCLSRSFDGEQPSVLQPDSWTATTSGSDALTDGDDAETTAVIQTIFGQLATPVITIEQVADATDADTELRQVRQMVMDGWPTSDKQLPAPLRTYFRLREELSVVYGGRCLLRGCRVTVPASLRPSILELAHEGHPGVIRMKSKCRESVWWPGIDADVERHVKNCQPCIASGKSVRPTSGPLLPVAWPTGPWKKLSLDIAGEFVAAPRHQRFMIVATDYYSKWPEVACCTSVTSSSVIDFLTGLFDRYGLVEEIVTDNGSQFVSSEFTDFLTSLAIKHTTVSLYSPQSNAAVERMNRVMKEGIRAGLADGQTFMTAVRQTLAAYRTTPHSTTGVSPASLFLAFPVRTPLTSLKQAVTSSPSSSSPALPAIAARVRFNQERMAAHYDQRCHAKPGTIQPGDQVRILLPVRAHKLAPKYSEPMAVAKAIGNTVWLTNGQKWNLRRVLRHKSNLRPNTPDTSLPSPSPPIRPAPVETANDDDDDDNVALFPFPVAEPSPNSREPPDPKPAPMQPPRRSQRRRQAKMFGPDWSK